MPMQPDAIQLRQILSERFPQLRQSAEPLDAEPERWPTGLAGVDATLRGGLRRGHLSEFVGAQPGCGTALLVRSLGEQAARVGQRLALIDGRDSFDPASCPAGVLPQILWVRCVETRTALKAGELVVRDGNLPVIVLDLFLNPEAELRRIQPAVWYRYQRLVELASAIFVVLTPHPLVAGVRERWRMDVQFDLEALSEPIAALMARVRVSPLRSAATAIAG